MEGYYNSNNPRIAKFEEIYGDISPVNAAKDGIFANGRGRTHRSFGGSTSENLEILDSTLIRYLRSGSPGSPTVTSTGDGFRTRTMDARRIRPLLDYKYSHSKSSSSGSRGSSSLSPLTAVEDPSKPSPSISPKVFATPGKVEEDVLVMDGILVGSSVPGGRIRLSSESGESSSSSSSSSGKSFYKTEICLAWVDSGSCRYGPKCQYAHGKAELRPTRVPNKTKAGICKSYATTGFCIYGSKCKYDHQAVSPAEAAEKAVETANPNPAPPIKPEHGGSGGKGDRGSVSTSGNWLPGDDGIKITLPSSMAKPLTREEEEAYIQSVLYGPFRRKRLQVFAEICPV